MHIYNKLEVFFIRESTDYDLYSKRQIISLCKKEITENYVSMIGNIEIYNRN